MDANLPPAGRCAASAQKTRTGGKRPTSANRLTGYLKPGEVTVYAKGLPGLLLQAQRMRADPQGDVAVVEEFWNFPPTDTEVDTVPPLLVYADLMATGDPRAIEAAGLIHAKYLARPDGAD